MAYSPVCLPQKKTGLIDIKIAVPFSGSLTQLGRATDQIRQSRRTFYHDVPGDANGGHQGPPIETQFLGEIWSVSMSLSTWNPTAINLLQTMACMATQGVVTQAEIGALVMTAKSIRLLLDTSDSGDVRNYWCALVREPIQIEVGTKYSEWVVGFECHRPPCGHAKAGIIYDADAAAYS